MMASQLNAEIDRQAADGEFAAFVHDLAMLMIENGMTTADVRRAANRIDEREKEVAMRTEAK